MGTVISNDEVFRAAATNAMNIDRLNLGPIPTTKLNWLQPHEGNLIDFLFRGGHYKSTSPPLDGGGFGRGDSCTRTLTNVSLLALFAKG